MEKYYTEPVNTADRYRRDYIDSIQEYTRHLLKTAAKKRVTPESMHTSREKYRRLFIKMLGKPLTDYKKSIPHVKSEYIGEDSLCRIYRLQMEANRYIKAYAVLCIPKTEGRHSAVIAQHGGGGTPELLLDMHGDNNYSHISKLALSKGCVVLAPQLAVWSMNVEGAFPGYAVSYDRNEIDQKLKMCGGSVTALEVYNIRKWIDYLETLDFVNPDKIGMLGLSYGGYFTLHAAAADTRIKAALSCAGFIKPDTLTGFYDWRYFNSAVKFFNAEIAGLCAPRLLCVDMGKTDHVFDWRGSADEAKYAAEFYKAANCPDSFVYNLWDGGHKIDVNGKACKRFFEYMK